jgi:hypothetical protein
MPMRKPVELILMLALSAMLSGRARAATIGQIDTFQDGTTQGWVTALLGSPNPSPPVNVPSGGPLGAGDGFLQLTSLGTLGPGGRLVAINPAQWTGNYIAAGITSISMDFKNLGATDIFLRLLFEDPMLAPPVDVATTSAVFLAAGGGWTSISFSVAAANLTAISGSVNTVLQNTTAFRIFNSQDPTFPGPPSESILGVDNIRADGVPEPGAWTMFAGGLSVLLAVRLRSRR